MIQFRYLETIWCFWFSLCCVGWAQTPFNPWLIWNHYWGIYLVSHVFEELPTLVVQNMNYFQLCVITSGCSAYLFPGVFFQSWDYSSWVCLSIDSDEVMRKILWRFLVLPLCVTLSSLQFCLMNFSNADLPEFCTVSPQFREMSKAWPWIFPWKFPPRIELGQS